MLSLHNVIQLTNIMFYSINDFKKYYLVVEFIVNVHRWRCVGGGSFLAGSANSLIKLTD